MLLTLHITSCHVFMYQMWSSVQSSFLTPMYNVLLVAQDRAEVLSIDHLLLYFTSVSLVSSHIHINMYMSHTTHILYPQCLDISSRSSPNVYSNL